MANPIHAPSFRVLAWPSDPAETVDALGEYAETYWAPILCPTAYLLGRRLVALSIRARVHDGEWLELQAETLARALGVWTEREPNANSENPNANLAIYHRAMKRLCKFHLVAFRGANLEVRLRWPRLNSGLLSALPVAMQQAEPEWWVREGGPVAEFVER